jgi:hypothetical protein
VLRIHTGDLATHWEVDIGKVLSWGIITDNGQGTEPGMCMGCVQEVIDETYLGTLHTCMGHVLLQAGARLASVCDSAAASALGIHLDDAVARQSPLRFWYHECA